MKDSNIMKFAMKATVSPIYTIEFEVAPNRIAELILKGFGADDFIVFADQLEAMRITIGGEVERREQ